MMYILIKRPAFLDDILSVMQRHGCTLHCIHSPTLTRKNAEVIYNNFSESPFYERAVQSVLPDAVGAPHVVVVLFDLPKDMAIAEFKRTVQGPYGTADPSTIRGHIAAALGDANEGYVHVPDSEEKAAEDIQVFGEPTQVF